MPLAKTVARIIDTPYNIGMPSSRYPEKYAIVSLPGGCQWR